MNIQGILTYIVLNSLVESVPKITLICINKIVYLKTNISYISYSKLF